MKFTICCLLFTTVFTVYGNPRKKRIRRALDICKTLTDGLYPYLPDCRKYVACSSGNTHIMPCPHGLWYDIKDKRCQYPQNTTNPGCKVPSSNSALGSVIKQACAGKVLGIVPHPAICSEYIVCDGSSDGVIKSCGPNNHFDPDYQVCVWKDIYPCSAKFNFCKGKKDGDYENIKKCDVFFKCVGGLTYVQKCPSGLWYNAATNQCDYPKSVNCKAHTTAVSPSTTAKLTTQAVTTIRPTQVNFCKGKKHGNYADPARCDGYIACTGNKMDRMDCPAGLWYDAKTDQCDWPKNVDCKVKTTSNPPKSTATSATTQAATTQADTTKAATTQHATIIKPTTSLVNFCKDKKHGNYADPTRCDGYIACTGNKLDRMDCPAGLWYNAKTDQCDWPKNVNCKAHRTTTPKSTTAKPQTTKKATQPATATGASPNICVGKTSGNYADPKRCSGFITCTGNRAVHMNCPAGLWYNETIDQCDWPNNVDCKIATTSQTRPTPPYSSFCRNKTNGVHTDPRSCKGYIICSVVGTYYLRCPSSMLFNPATKKCEAAANVKCNGRPTSTPVTCNGRVGSFPYPRSCSSILVCEASGNAYIKNCPSGLHFHPKYRVCVWEYNYPCVNGRPIGQICVRKADGNYRDPDRCDGYIACSGGLRYPMNCPAHLWWNAATNKCDYPKNVNCKRTFSTVMPTVSHFSTRAQTTRPTQDTRTTQDTTYRATTRGTTTSPFSCKGRKHGNYPDPTRCDGYIACTGNKMDRMDCPAGLWYNVKTDQCDWPKHVHCHPKTTVHPSTTHQSTHTHGLTRGTRSPQPTGFTGTPPPNFCNGKKTGNHRNPSRCDGFITCVGTVSYGMACPHGLWYNETTDKCDFPDLVMCNVQSSKKAFCVNKAPGKYPLPTKCNQYYECYRSAGQLQTCRKHTNFYPALGICVWSYSYSCEDPKFCVGKSDGDYINSNNCYGYYKCSAGRTFPRNCNTGLRFNGKKCVSAASFICS